MTLYLTREEATEKISALVQQLNPAADAATIEFYSNKLVLDVLDYCHRDNFPEALIYTAAGALAKNFGTSDGDGSATVNAPLKAITQDDVKYEFAVATAEVDTTFDAATTVFNSLKARLNIYRKLVAL